jgi:hypothetical protein
MKDFFTVSEIAELTGKTRDRISGIISGLGLPSYRGPNNSKLIDAAGLRRILAALIPRPEFEPTEFGIESQSLERVAV